MVNIAQNNTAGNKYLCPRLMMKTFIARVFHAHFAATTLCVLVSCTVPLRTVLMDNSVYSLRGKPTAAVAPPCLLFITSRLEELTMIMLFLLPWDI